MQNEVRDALQKAVPQILVEELLAAYVEAKSNFYLGGHRLSTVEGGRFCEAAFRILQYKAFGTYDSLDKKIDTEGLIRQLGGIPRGSQPESIRLFIPRSLRIIYDIRNNRDAAHLAGGIDANAQDSTLVISVLDWVLAELYRLFNDVAPQVALAVIEGLVTRKIPVVEEINGHPKVLNPKLKVSDVCLVLLYNRNSRGTTFEEMKQWVKPDMRSNLKRTLQQLEHDKAFIHYDGAAYKITQAGKAEVERKKLFEA